VRERAAMLPPSGAVALSGREPGFVALIADDQGGRADRARLVVLACQDGLAALPARAEEISCSTCVRQSSR
jgi:hypothetical protein